MKKFVCVLTIALLATNAAICYNLFKQRQENKKQADEWEQIIQLATRKD